MRSVPLAPAPPSDSAGKVQWLLDRVTQLCTASQVNTAEDVAAENEELYQPLDSDLTAIAALSTTAFGRSLLTQASAGALVSTLGLVIGTNTQAWDVLLDMLAALSDPGADRITFWDESAGSGGALAWLATSSGLEIDTTNLRMTANQRTTAIGWQIDGGGAPITTGNKIGLQVPFACTITSWSIGADVSGSIVIDIWKEAAGSYPPTVADTITASAKPTISGAQYATSSTLTGWTTSVAAGDWLFFNVDSISTITKATISLTVTKT